MKLTRCLINYLEQFILVRCDINIKLGNRVLGCHEFDSASTISDVILWNYRALKTIDMRDRPGGNKILPVYARWRGETTYVLLA